MKQMLFGSIRCLPLQVYITIFIILIILVVTALLCGLSYLSARDELLAANEIAIRSTDQYAVESEMLVDKGLDIYDNSYNDELKACFPAFLDAYKHAGEDPETIDFDLLRRQTEPMTDGKRTFFVINKSDVIVASSVTGALNLDFKKHPDYYAYLSQGMSNDSFFADRVSHAIVGTESGNVTGKMTKWAFMPTSDHEYLLELGFTTPGFDQKRSEISTVVAAEDLRTFNPNMVAVRVFDKNKYLLTRTGMDANFSADAGLSGYSPVHLPGRISGPPGQQPGKRPITSSLLCRNDFLTKKNRVKNNRKI
ncbi:MAG: hypothetical protein WC620_10550 [Methanoregula sp.]|jgi:hypothetical protein